MTTAGCDVHKTHVPKSHINEKHHIHPLGYHGPNKPTNIVVTCATGHNTIHELLEKMLKAGTAELPYKEVRGYSVGERHYARSGFFAVMAYGQSLSTP